MKRPGPPPHDRRAGRQHGSSAAGPERVEYADADERDEQPRVTAIDPREQALQRRERQWTSRETDTGERQRLLDGREREISARERNADQREINAEVAGWDEYRTDPPPGALDVEAVVRLGALTRSFQDLDDVKATVRAIVAAAVDTIPGAAHAGLLPAGGQPVTAVAVTDQVVSQIDQAQRDTGEGPAMTSLRERRTVRVNDLATDPRWPRFAAQVTHLGVGSILAVHVCTRREDLGVLTLSSRGAHAFHHDAVRLAELFTAHAAVAMAAAQNVQHLTTALSDRDAIGQAKGILMERHRLTADQAIAMLTRAGRNTDTRLADVAQLLIETGLLTGVAPDTSTHPRKPIVSPVVRRD